MTSLRQRIGFDAGGTPLEDALAWASAHDFHDIDFNADREPNHLASWSGERVQALRETCKRHGIHLGLHTLSGVNVAAFSPFVSDAVDEYLHANIDFARRLGCEWIVVHAGYHFGAHVEARKSASLEHLKHAVEHTKTAGVLRLQGPLHDGLRFRGGQAGGARVLRGMREGQVVKRAWFFYTVLFAPHFCSLSLWERGQTANRGRNGKGEPR